MTKPNLQGLTAAALTFCSLTIAFSFAAVANENDLMNKDQRDAVFGDLSRQRAADIKGVSTSAQKKTRVSAPSASSVKTANEKNGKTKRKESPAEKLFIGVYDSVREKIQPFINGAAIIASSIVDKTLKDLESHFSSVVESGQTVSIWYYPASELKEKHEDRHRLLLVFDHSQAPNSDSSDPRDHMRCADDESTRLNKSNQRVPCGKHFRAFRFEPKEKQGKEIGNGLTYNEFMATMEMMERNQSKRNQENEFFKKGYISPEGEVMLGSVVSFAAAATAVGLIGKPPKAIDWPNPSNDPSVVWNTPENEAFAKKKKIPWPPSQLLDPVPTKSSVYIVSKADWGNNKWKLPEGAKFESVVDGAEEKLGHGHVPIKKITATVSIYGGDPFDIDDARRWASGKGERAIAAGIKLLPAPDTKSYKVRNAVTKALNSSYVKKVTRFFGNRVEAPAEGWTFRGASGKAIKFFPSLLYDAHKRMQGGQIFLFMIEFSAWQYMVEDKIKMIMNSLHDVSEKKLAKEANIVAMIARAWCYASIPTEWYETHQGIARCQGEKIPAIARWEASQFSDSSDSEDVQAPSGPKQFDALEAAHALQNEAETKSESSSATGLASLKALQSLNKTIDDLKRKLKKSSLLRFSREKSDPDFYQLDREMEKIMNQYDLSAKRAEKEEQDKEN